VTGVTTTKAVKKNAKGAVALSAGFSNPSFTQSTPALLAVNTKNVSVSKTFKTCSRVVPVPDSSYALGCPADTLLASGSYSFHAVTASGAALSAVEGGNWSGKLSVFRGKKAMIFEFCSTSPLPNFCQHVASGFGSTGFKVTLPNPTALPFADLAGGHVSFDSLSLAFAIPTVKGAVAPLVAKKSKGTFLKPKVSVAVS
jgi:hypothetical protein